MTKQKCKHTRRWTKWRQVSPMSPLYGKVLRLRKCNGCLTVQYEDVPKAAGNEPGH